MVIAGAFDPGQGARAGGQVLRPDPRRRRACCPSSTPTSRSRTATGRSSCAASPARNGCPRCITRCPARIRTRWRLEAAVDIMTLTPGGRLYKALVESKKAVVRRRRSSTTATIPVSRCFSRRCRKRNPIDAARVAMLQTIEGVEQQPFTADELDRVRAKELKDIDETLNDPQRLGIALSSAIADGDWRLFFLRRDQWRKVTPADVDRVASAYFKPANRTVGEFIPDAAPDRSPTPPSRRHRGDGQGLQGRSGHRRRRSLRCNARQPRRARAALHARQRHEGRAAAEKDPRRNRELLPVGCTTATSHRSRTRRGQATLTGGMLMRGTTKHSRQEIEDTLDKLKATLTVQGGQTGAVRARSDRACQCRADPGFARRSPAVARISCRGAGDAQACCDRGRRAESHRSPLDRRARAAALRKSVPERRRSLRADRRRGNRRAAGARRRRAQAFPSRVLRRVGRPSSPSSATSTRPPSRRSLSACSAHGSRPCRFARVPQPLIAKKRNRAMPIETPDKANAFFVGQTAFALNDKDPDYPALMLANYIFGGSPNSRLWNRIRQKDGLSYGINSSTAREQLRAQQHCRASGAIFAPENLGRLRTGVQEELDRARERRLHRRGGGRGQGRRDAATQARAQPGCRSWRAGSWSRPISDARSRTQREIDKAIEALTPDQVNAAFRKYVKPDAFAAFFAGDFAKKK